MPVIDHEWLKGLKTGDEVVVTGTYLTELQTIMERDDSRIITTWGNGATMAFDAYGYLPNGVTHLIAPTPERRRDIERWNLEGAIRAVRWGACSLDQLRRIAEVLNL